ncbi:MAG: ABC transporter permease, partial [Ureaplasma sp.]|nr:ABC transporter permease [Ureaplasma sp.]
LTKLENNRINGNINEYLNLKSNLEITNFVAQLDSKYTININNLPYVIIGTGVSPDFLYPIISFANNIPDPKKECLVYVNKTGYDRADVSFGSSPHENFLVARYRGNLTETEILSKVNQLAKTNMSWPSNITAAYWYNDLNNKMTPSSVRIKFITSLINIFIVIAIVIAFFVLILVIFTMIIFSKNFIAKNKLSLAILLSNGFSKTKILISIAFISSFICVIACPLGLLAGHYFEFTIFGILSNYWFIPTPIVMYNAGWFILTIIIPLVILVLINFVVGWFAMKKNLVDLLKVNDELIANKLYISFSPLIRWAKVLYKYKVSLAFSSLTKMFFIFALTTLSIVTMNVGISVTNKLNNAYQLEMDSNYSTFNIDMATPTSQGGQYFGLDANDIGRSLTNKKGDPIFNNIDYANNSFLSSTYQSSALFRNYIGLHIPTMNDSDEINSNIIYMKNRVQTQELLNYFFGIGDLGVNPWDVFKSISPQNQQNESNNLSIDLKEKLLTDMRPLNQAWFSRLNNLSLIQPNTTAANKNYIDFPTYWVVQNFNSTNPSTIKLSMPDNLTVNNKLININPSEVGVINAAELLTKDSSNNIIPLFSSPKDVIDNWSNFATLVNNAYQSYAQLNPETGEQIPVNPVDKLSVKYCQELFTQSALENPILCDDNETIIFKVNYNLNANKYLITYRSMLFSYMTRETITDNSVDNLNNDYIFDKFDNQSYIQHKYAYKINSSKALTVLPFTFNTNFLNFILSIYN